MIPYICINEVKKFDQYQADILIDFTPYNIVINKNRFGSVKGVIGNSPQNLEYDKCFIKNALMEHIEAAFDDKLKYSDVRRVWLVISSKDLFILAFENFISLVISNTVLRISCRNSKIKQIDLCDPNSMDEFLVCLEKLGGSNANLFDYRCLHCLNRRCFCQLRS